jgi:hypothetical protein
MALPSPWLINRGLTVSLNIFDHHGVPKLRLFRSWPLQDIWPLLFWHSGCLASAGSLRQWMSRLWMAMISSTGGSECSASSRLSEQQGLDERMPRETSLTLSRRSSTQRSRGFKPNKTSTLKPWNEKPMRGNDRFKSKLTGRSSGSGMKLARGPRRLSKKASRISSPCAPKRRIRLRRWKTSELRESENTKRSTKRSNSSFPPA